MAKILMAMASEAQSTLLMKIFSKAELGYELLVTHSSQEVLDITQIEKIDLLLIEPFIDSIKNSYELVTMLKANQTTNSIRILFTSLGSNFDYKRALEAGSDDYLARPFSPKELVEKVRAMLKRG